MDVSGAAPSTVLLPRVEDMSKSIYVGTRKMVNYAGQGDAGETLVEARSDTTCKSFVSIWV